jgi:LPXTG-site transpeptidase (sortase) family protein
MPDPNHHSATDTATAAEVEQAAEHTASADGNGPRRDRGRRAVRILGWMLILAALGIGGYLAQQLWWTGIATERAQDDLADRFEERLSRADAGSSPELVDPSDPGTEPPQITAPDEDAAADEFDDRDDVPVLVAPTGSFIEATLDPPSGLVREAAPPESDALGRIVIPEIGVDWIVVEGVSAWDLRRGPGHMPGTALPGQFGNAVISGHRTTNGAPFHDLGELEPGSEIRVETLIGDHVYEVVETRIVAPTELWVASQWNGAWLTLTTCHPKYSSRQRLIVFAHLVDGPNAGTITALYPGPYDVPGPS